MSKAIRIRSRGWRIGLRSIGTNCFIGSDLGEVDDPFEDAVAGETANNQKHATVATRLPPSFDAPKK